MPSFRRWLMSNLSNEFVRNAVPTDKWTLFEQLVKSADPELIDLFENELVKICTYYLTRAKKPDGTVECSVGNFKHNSDIFCKIYRIFSIKTLSLTIYSFITPELIMSI